MTMRWLALILAASMLTAGVAVADEARGDRPGGADGPAALREEHRERQRELREELREEREELREEREELREEREDRREDREDRAEKREKARAHFEKRDAKWVLRNDDMTIWFHQGERSKPVLAVFRTGEDGNRSGFRLQLDELFEAVAPADKPAPGNGTGNATGNGTRPGHDGDDDRDDEDDDDGPKWKRARGHRVNLHPAREWWTHVENGTSEVTITMAHLFNQGNVSLVFHVPKGSGAVKFDVKVQDWKWADANNTLALRLKVLERGARHAGDNATFAGGWVSWASTANVTYPNGTAATIPVGAEVRNHGEGARILLRFDGPGGYTSLDYDPTIGVMGSDFRAVPVPGALAALGVLGLAALAAAAGPGTRRRP